MKHLKVDRIAFINGCKEVIFRYGGIATGKCKITGWNLFFIDLPNNKLILKIEPEEDQDVVFSVFGRYDTPTAIGNPCSGKRNFHQIADNECWEVQDTIDHFEDFIKESITKANNN